MNQAHGELGRRLAALRADFAALGTPRRRRRRGADRHPAAPHRPARGADRRPRRRSPSCAPPWSSTPARCPSCSTPRGSAPCATWSRCWPPSTPPRSSRARLAAWEEARKGALVVLDRVMALIHREEKALRRRSTECQERARELHVDAGRPGARRISSTRRRCCPGKVRPYAELLALVEGWNVLDDDRCAVSAGRDHRGVRPRRWRWPRCAASSGARARPPPAPAPRVAAARAPPRRRPRPACRRSHRPRRRRRRRCRWSRRDPPASASAAPVAAPHPRRRAAAGRAGAVPPAPPPARPGRARRLRPPPCPWPPRRARRRRAGAGGPMVAVHDRRRAAGAAGGPRSPARQSLVVEIRLSGDASRWRRRRRAASARASSSASPRNPRAGGSPRAAGWNGDARARPDVRRRGPRLPQALPVPAERAAGQKSAEHGRRPAGRGLSRSCSPTSKSRRRAS